MATVYPIKVVQIGDDIHELLPKYIQDGTGAAKTWADIVAIASEAGLELKSEDELPEIPSGQEQAAAFYDLWKKRLVLILSSNPGTQNIKDEYIIQRDGETAPFTYRWEQIGSTEVDLSNYVQKGVTYTGAAQSNGAHSHTVAVPTVSVDKTKKLGATATGIDVTLTKDAFVKSYPGVTSKMVTTSVKGVSGTTTASKATAGSDITLAKRAASQTTVGNANVGTAVTVATKAASATKVGNADVGDAVSIPNVTGNTSVTTTFVNTPQNTTITEVTGKTAGSAAAWSASVSTDGNGVLSFSFTPNVPTAITTADVTNVIRSNASSGTIVENRTSSNTSLGTAISVTPAKAVGTGSTEIYGCGDNTSVTPAVASTTKIYGVGDTETITPYTFADVAVPVAAESATTVATGSLAANGSGASVMTGLGTAVTAQAVTDVSVTNPTVEITESTTNTGPVNEHVTVGSNPSATTSTDGAHTHDVNVAS